MSEQRRIRAELKQGLHQFTMSLYHQYKKTMGHDDAVESVIKCIVEEYEYYAKQSIETKNVKDNHVDLEPFIIEIEKRSKKETDSDKHYNDLERLMTSKETTKVGIQHKYRFRYGSNQQNIRTRYDIIL